MPTIQLKEVTLEKIGSFPDVVTWRSGNFRDIAVLERKNGNFLILTEGGPKQLKQVKDYDDWKPGSGKRVFIRRGDEIFTVTEDGEKFLSNHGYSDFIAGPEDGIFIRRGNELSFITKRGEELSLGTHPSDLIDGFQRAPYGDLVIRHENEFLLLGRNGERRSYGEHPDVSWWGTGVFGLLVGRSGEILRVSEEDHEETPFTSCRWSDISYGISGFYTRFADEFFMADSDGTMHSLGNYSCDGWGSCFEGVVFRQGDDFSLLKVKK